MIPTEIITAMTCGDDPAKFIKNAPESSWLWSLKLDGVRTLTCDIDADVSFWSRSGKPFPNFHRFSHDVAKIADLLRQVMNVPRWWPVWFDGEMVSKSREFKGVMQQLRRHKDVDPSVFEYHLFDIPTLKTLPLTQRLETLRTLVGNATPTDIHCLSHVAPVNGWASVERVFKDAVELHGEEGIIVKDGRSFYVGSRSVSWLKLKAEETLDLPVVGFKPGKGKYSGMVGALTCQLPNGKTVDVSGFSDEQRAWFTMDLPEMIEVKHNGATSGGKLRHPRFVCVREDK